MIKRVGSENVIWEPVESSRTIQAFRCADWQMMIIPSLQGIEHPAYHVIVDRAGENGLLTSILLTKEQILDHYGIEI
jgi:hypothetical protein